MNNGIFFYGFSPGTLRFGRTSAFAFFRIIAIVAGFLTLEQSALCQGWDTIKVQRLPDTSFAVIEYDGGKRVRHCPHHELNGHLDVEQLIFVLGTLDRIPWINETSRDAANKHLQKHYQRFIAEANRHQLAEPVNINEAKLAELVHLPVIGPVLAVRIAEYRQKEHRFASIMDIKQVDGIGPGIFSAIRHYIYVDE